MTIDYRRIDYIATHKYSGDADEVMSLLEEYSRRYDNKKIWLTEFAVNNENNKETIVAYVEDILPKESTYFLLNLYLLPGIGWLEEVLITIKGFAPPPPGSH